MQILQVTLWMYATALRRSLECLLRNWVVSFAPVVYGIGLTIVGTLVAPLGIIGGFLYSIASAACASSALYLIKNLVESGKTDVRDFLNGFTVYLWEVIGASYNFIVENWVEWLIPNLILFAAGYFLLDFVGSLFFGMPGFVQLFLYAFVLGLCLTYLMTFRGFLFAELYGT